MNSTRSRVGGVAKSVTAGIVEASKLEDVRKRKLDERSALAKKRAKVFSLPGDASGSDDSSEDEAGPSTAAP